jgi:hypothetical protein
VLKVTKTALQRFEVAADTAFASQQLPHPNSHVSAWYFLTVSEDSQRLLFANLGKQMDDWRVEYFLDRYKFSLRHCLLALRREARDTTVMPLPANVVPELYERTHHFLAAGIDYSDVAQICSSAHSGSSRIVDEEPGFAVELNQQLLDKRYGALELMRQSGGELVIPWCGVLWFWIRHSEQAPLTVRQIAESTRLSRRRIRYVFEPELSRQLGQSLPQQPFLIPDGWRFPWGGRHETTLLINALCLRVAYHVIAVHFGAARIRLRGGAESDICFCISDEELVHDIYTNSSLEPVQIRKFVEYLTYARGVDSPDQALQPLVPLGGNRLGVAGIGLLSSNVERNLLTLQARLEPRLFDSQSSLFEIEMTRDLRFTIEQKWQRVAANRKFQLGGASEEIDLLVCEPETRTVLVLELRWMLPPADPREVQIKKRTCFEKVEQAKRKVAAANSDIARLLRVAFGITTKPSEAWNVFGAVVVQGYGGAISQRDLIPVIPDWVLKAGICSAPSLLHLANWMQSLTWLPVEGRDFDVQESNDLLGIQIRHLGLAPIRQGRDYLSDATFALRSARQNVTFT